MNCPINHCAFVVAGPLRICKAHFRLVPRPQADALSHYARHHKGGPAHHAAFERAVESVTKLIEARRSAVVADPERPVSLPYKDD
jgi:hypothetical protein